MYCVCRCGKREMSLCLRGSECVDMIYEQNGEIKGNERRLEMEISKKKLKN